MGYRKLAAWPKHHAQDPQAIEAFKKLPRRRGGNYHRSNPRQKRLEIWFEDEARIGQKNKITRRWAKRGTRPSAPHDQRTRSAYIFGAMQSARSSARRQPLVIPWCDTYAMTQHLIEISRHVAKDAPAILIMDQAA